MKLYIYTYASFADELARTDWTKNDDGKIGVYFSRYEPSGDQVGLGVIDIPADEIKSAICGRDTIVQRAVAAFDAEAQGLRIIPDSVVIAVEGKKHVTQVRVLTDDADTVSPDLRAELDQAVGLEAGDRFDEHPYEHGKEQLLAVLAASGHCHARVTGAVRILRAALTAEVDYQVTVGPTCTVGAVEVTGNDGSLYEFA